MGFPNSTAGQQEKKGFMFGRVVTAVPFVLSFLSASSAGVLAISSPWVREQQEVAAGLCRNNSTNSTPAATVLFLHIFKAAGSTTRETLKG